MINKNNNLKINFKFSTNNFLSLSIKYSKINMYILT